VRLTVDGLGAGELAALVRRARRFLDLDADPQAVDGALGAEEPLRALVAACPGRRLPGAFDAWETTVLAVLGQGVSLRAATSVAGRLAAGLGDAVDVGVTGIDRLFPSPAVLAQADLSPFGLPRRRAETLRALAIEVAQRRIDLEDGEPGEVLAALGAIPGIGAWTTGYVALRVLRDPDARLPGDAAVTAALRRLGLPTDRAAVDRTAERWRPWRGYAYVHLWSVER
jgi:AraC family transcriptional regulator of adaptative response / DNA-3-methyladenine glycosylase II